MCEIITEKFDEITVGYYKLVDKEGWLNNNEWNENLYKYFDKNDIVNIDSMYNIEYGTNKQALHNYDCAIIGERENKFFEKVVSEYPPKLETQSVNVPSTEHCDLENDNHLIQMMSLARSCGMAFYFDPEDDVITATDVKLDLEFKIKTQEEFDELCEAITSVRKYLD